MALDQVDLNAGSGGDSIGVDNIAGVSYEVVKQAFGAAGALTLVDAANPLPVTVLGIPALAADAATESEQVTQTALLSDIANDQATEVTLALVKTNTDKIPSQGQALAAASLPVVLTAAQITTLTPPAAISGFATSAKQDSLLAELQLKADLTDTQPVSLASVPSHPVTNAGTFPVQSTIAAAIPAGANVIGKVSIDQTTPGTTNLVALAANQSVKEIRSTTPAQSSPSVTNSSTSILASNANRLGGTVYNEGAAICYMKLGATASATSYSIQIAPGGYYEIPFNYTGAIDGITSSGTAQLRVTEIS